VTATGSPRRLNVPLPAKVQADSRGRPLSVDGRAVDAVRESWVVEDRWWTEAPLRRRYWEVVTTTGELLVLFRELDGAGGWHRQR
jgi:CO dehydrogenase/acetyl-CoA synthase delta subunit